LSAAEAPEHIESRRRELVIAASQALQDIASSYLVDMQMSPIWISERPILGLLASASSEIARHDASGTPSRHLNRAIEKTALFRVT
jgi:hypothetical protein